MCRLGNHPINLPMSTANWLTRLLDIRATRQQIAICLAFLMVFRRGTGRSMLGSDVINRVSPDPDGAAPRYTATGSPPAVDLRQELTPPLGREVQRPRTQNDLRAVPGPLHLCLWAFTIPKFVSDGDRRCGWTAERYDRTTQIAAQTMRIGAGDCRRWRFGRSIAPGSSTQRLGPPPSAHLA